MSLDKNITGIVIPYYNAKDSIVEVVSNAIKYSHIIIIVNDKSPDELPYEKLHQFEGVTIIENQINLGVGGATKRGFEYLQNIEGLEVFLKLDSDNQMDTNFIPKLVSPIINEGFGLAKGNRFRDFKALKSMPFARRFGNLFLSFLSKAATGYWNCFDFNNGFFAISKATYTHIDKNSLADNYFFETSLIASLYFQKGMIKEIAMPAIYGNENSNMKLFKMPLMFLANLSKKFISRIWKTYFMYDFNIGTLYILFGLPLFIIGVIYGGYNWYHFASKGILTPVGTIMISVVMIILGFQLLLQAVQFDIINTPKKHNNE